MAATAAWGMMSLGMNAQMPNPGCIGDLDDNALVDLDDLMMLLTYDGSECVVIPGTDGFDGNLAISEIMYNPSAEQGNDSDYEIL